ncbi:MAG: hypothetical protein QNJ98_00965 [Planctomycetota bacterium]|nr:hypothetical protein [Planctomycetota bacterium]
MTIVSPRAARVSLLLAAVLLVVPLTACGGSSKDTTPIPQSITVGPDGDFTGHIVEVTPGMTYAVTTNAQIQAGDDTANNWRRGFVRFDLSTIPAGAQVQSATIRITQVAPTGTPYADLLTNLQVDHIDAGAMLDDADFSANSLALNIGTISMDATTGERTLGVGVQVALDLAQARTTSDFRFTFPIQTDNNGDDDFAAFIAANLIGGPVLELDLLVPPP